MAFADARARRVLAAASLVAGLAACAPAEIPDPDIVVEIPSDAELTGRVSAAGPADLAVDIGLARPVMVALADITAVDCVRGGADAYASGLDELASVGDAVTLVRSNAPAQPDHDLPDHDLPDHDLTAFVHTVEQDRRVEASLNEMLVRTGRARLDPPIDHSAGAAPVRDQAAADAAELPEPDRRYHDVIAAAEEEAWQARTGLLGECAAEQEALDRDRDPMPSSEPTPPQTPPQTAPQTTPQTAPPTETPRIETTDKRPETGVTPRRSPRPRSCELLDRC